MAFVLDASIALSWCFPDESNEKADSILLRCEQEKVFVPSIWPIEISNALLVGWRRKRLTQEQVETAMRLLSLLDIQISTSHSIQHARRIIQLAQQWELSTYDASYLDLALQEGIPLATADEKLAVAAKKSSIPLF